MKPAAAALVLVLLAACLLPRRVTLTDSQGRTFVRVREMRLGADGVGEAELWQMADDTGPDRPHYLRLLTSGDAPPLFTRAQ